MLIRLALLFLSILLVLGVLPARADSEIQPIQFCGSRPARPTEPPWIPLPEKAPLTLAQADSVIRAKAGGAIWPQNRYDIFEVDLDGDGTNEQIAQVARITPLGYYSETWWGVYAGGKLNQVLYWFYAEERSRIARIPRPTSLRDKADSLGFQSSVPEFYPAVDVTSCGDITGDGKPEIVVWMIGRIAQNPTVRAFMSPAILSPGASGLDQIFRGNLILAQRKGVVRGKEGVPECRAVSFRLRTRIRKAGGARDLLLEPWMPISPDSLCMSGWVDERGLPHDPDQWMPVAPLGPRDPVPPNWVISRWEDGKYGGYWFVKDVKLQ
jgi:hypothetical protein